LIGDVHLKLLSDCFIIAIWFHLQLDTVIHKRWLKR
jgi:hypothetical protein